MRMSKFVFGFHPDYFDFLSDKMRAPGKTISKNFEKDTKSIVLLLAL